ncbi:MAG: hypothetical protein WHW07_04560 [Bacteroidales bacterium]|nr:hypothetical protein [Bacteroidales bacterium]HOL98131.1 hypothetical protein [Bacteroidales bacterium]HOM36240.1 hypothetical protein [Bacteroidales bacterium]HPD23771.1 hypothetical protein [Bacteroidales bacterium]HRS99751.1 hypothetical protein [Bacteroidales bacterium]
MKKEQLFKFLILIFISFQVIFIISCETIYNYDLSITGVDSFPATKSCLQKYIPKSIDALAGKQEKELRRIAFELDTYKSEILDSLEADSVRTDTVVILKFTIIALDPYNQITEFPVKKNYHR